MRNIICLLLIFYTANCFPSELIVRKSIDLDVFPIISFEVNLSDPDIYDKSFFKLEENGSLVDFSFNALPVVHDRNAKKAVLVIMEDMTNLHHPGQRRFFERVLNQRLSDVIYPGDKINLAVFDRSRRGDPALRYLLDEYTSNPDDLLEAISNYRTPDDVFSNQVSSDIYFALIEGINSLRNLYPEHQKLILLLSAGKNNELSTEPTADRAIALAKKYRIPVYSIQYALPGWDHNRLIGLIVSTHGLEVVTRNVKIASDSLVSFLNKSIERAKGRNYSFTYSSTHPKNGKEHAYVLYCKDVPHEFKFISPAKTWQEALRENLVYLLAGGFLLLMLIGLVIFFIIRNSRTRKRKALEELDLKNKLQEQQREMQIISKKLEQEKTTNAQQLNDTRFRQLLRNGARPVLAFISNGKSINYYIRKPMVNIGRNKANDLCIEDASISELHARILFDANGFLWRDLNSPGGSYINKKRILQHYLNDGDVIKIGTTTLKFYL